MTGRRALSLEPLTAEEFAPFGELVQPQGSGAVVNDGFARRYETGTQPRPADRDLVPCLAIYEVWPRAHPIVIDRVECHPYTTQTFLPQCGQPYLVVVAPIDRSGGPQADAARAFAADGSAGLTYHTGVWHAGLTCLHGRGTFTMLMWVGASEDTSFHDLAPALAVDAPGERESP